MDLKNFYQKVGGSYEEIRSRLPTDKLVEKFILMFPKEPCFENLKVGMENQDWKAAFAACHTLKGVSANLALTKLHNSTEVLTEDLRSGTPAPNAQQDFEQVKKDFENVIAAINEGVAQ